MMNPPPATTARDAPMRVSAIQPPNSDSKYEPATNRPKMALAVLSSIPRPPSATVATMNSTRMARMP